MRIGRGCEHCRLRHIRCNIRSGASSCDSCARLGRICRLDPLFRFKSVRHVYQKSQGAAARFELDWDSAQTWVKVPQSLTFVQESTEESIDGVGGAAESEDEEHPPHKSALEPSFGALPRSSHLPLSSLAGPPEVTGIIAAENSGTGEQPAASSAMSPQTITSIISPPASTSTLTGITSPTSPSTPRSTTAISLSFREAFLLRLFIQKIAPWTDICDLRSHFSAEVPRRALQVPMVLKSVLALSARLDAILSDTSDWEATEYHGQCLELLIDTLAKPEDTYDDNLLITVVILRIYEEFEWENGENCHFLGSNRLLNTMTKSASSGGLAEAVSWQFLRQAIFASIVQCQPMQLDLGNYERSAVFQRKDDAAYANVIVFFCARIIQLYSCGPGCLVDEDEWHILSESVEEWYRTRPTSWQPLQYKAASPEDNRPFPELWMMSAPAAVGLQYYHTCCILLTSADRHWGTVSNYDLARLRRVEENTIASHIIQVIGLSISNETVENAYFMACHLLVRYGYCLRHPVVQRGTLEFLKRVEKVIGWRTANAVRELKKQWGELRDLDLWGGDSA
ncbi:uncharacterized protein ATNIH1004_003540 [Aspergillus tanneri]|uniref:Zn(2)-C6 fungal-type domain-containing protein n=1 Tax=Aspergillus tanneri TaxID=1220188 RepID=A0A5M9MUR8_9EURO|nr:uncharacterized protein ATNIH1004_003540 [Aspergillus tanneri]KAA8650851.1 hypothetical protein ATNIH1004_003540 [Aspergillus tanneri]